jgi:hypothetical protein
VEPIAYFAEPAETHQLPPLLQGFGAVPPLVTDIDLSVDDRFLYVSCWGTGTTRGRRRLLGLLLFLIAPVLMAPVLIARFS